MEPAVFAGLLLFVFQIYAPLRHLFTTTSVFSIMENSLNRIEEVMQQAPLKDDGTQTVPEQAEQEIAFDHVSFSYGSEQVLHNLSFHAKRQQMILYHAITIPWRKRSQELSKSKRKSRRRLHWSRNTILVTVL
jgi:ATP-binding cassette subfamily B protein